MGADRGVGADRKAGGGVITEVIGTLSMDGLFSWLCWCDRFLDFTMGEPSKRTCDCGKIWAWDGAELTLRPSARHAVIGPDDEIVRDDAGDIVWGWFEQDAEGNWI